MQANKRDTGKIDRLKRRSDFLRVQKNNKKWVSKSVIIQTAPGETGSLRYGITVSKRISKSAVVRNRIKRRLRAAIADTFPFHAQFEHDYVLIGRQETETRDYETIKRDIIWCLEKLDRKRGGDL